MMRIPACTIAVAAAAATTTAIAETIHVHGGAEITGDILLRKADTLIVDLGFRVIEIPADGVKRDCAIVTSLRSGLACDPAHCQDGRQNLY